MKATDAGGSRSRKSDTFGSLETSAHQGMLQKSVEVCTQPFCVPRIYIMNGRSFFLLVASPHPLLTNHPSLPAMASLSERVFGAFELLDDILLNPPMLDILIFQRVNTAWKDTIAKSILLQRKLFLSPVAPGPVSKQKHGLTLHDLEFNPILRKSMYWNPKIEKFGDVELCGPSVAFQRVDYPSALWRKMLFTQPPCEALGVFNVQVPELCTTVANKDGVTVGEMMKGMIQVVTFHLHVALTAIRVKLI